MKILHVLGEPGVGGIEKLVLDLSIFQKDDSDIEVEIYFTFKSRTSDFAPAYENSNIPLHYGNYSSGFDMSLGKSWLTLKLFERYDVIHLHTFNPVTAFIAFITNAKVVVTDHGTHGKGRVLKLKDKVKFLFEKYFLNHCVSLITFNSKFTEKESRQRFGLTNVDGVMVYNGISKNDADINSSEVAQDIESRLAGKFVVGTSSRFASFKRIDRLVDGFNRFQADVDTVLLLVGDGPELGALKKQVESFGIEDKVIFSGYRINVRQYQNVMDVCVFPSKGEPFGLVSVETLSLGKAVIVFKDGGGIVEVIEGFQKDDIVDDVAGLANRLHYYHENSVSTGEAAARQVYADSFSVELMANKFKDIYFSLCADK